MVLSGCRTGPDSRIEKYTPAGRIGQARTKDPVGKRVL